MDDRHLSVPVVCGRDRKQHENDNRKVLIVLFRKTLKLDKHTCREDVFSRKRRPLVRTLLFLCLLPLSSFRGPSRTCLLLLLRCRGTCRERVEAMTSGDDAPFLFIMNIQVKAAWFFYNCTSENNDAS